MTQDTKGQISNSDLFLLKPSERKALLKGGKVPPKGRAIIKKRKTKPKVTFNKRKKKESIDLLDIPAYRDAINYSALPSHPPSEEPTTTPDKPLSLTQYLTRQSKEFPPRSYRIYENWDKRKKSPTERRMFKTRREVMKKIEGRKKDWKASREGFDLESTLLSVPPSSDNPRGEKISQSTKEGKRLVVEKRNQKDKEYQLQRETIQQSLIENGKIPKPNFGYNVVDDPRPTLTASTADGVKPNVKTANDPSDWSAYFNEDLNPQELKKLRKWRAAVEEEDHERNNALAEMERNILETKLRDAARAKIKEKKKEKVKSTNSKVTEVAEPTVELVDGPISRKSQVRQRKKVVQPKPTKQAVTPTSTSISSSKPDLTSGSRTSRRKVIKSTTKSSTQSNEGAVKSIVEGVVSLLPQSLQGSIDSKAIADGISKIGDDLLSLWNETATSGITSTGSVTKKSRASTRKTSQSTPVSRS